MLPRRSSSETSFHQATFDSIVARANAALDAMAQSTGTQTRRTHQDAPLKPPMHSGTFTLDLQPRIEFAPSSRALLSRNTPRSIDVALGTISWHEFQSSAPHLSARFLADVLEGEVALRSRGEASEYTTILSNGHYVAGGVRACESCASEWSTYVRVANVDETCELALALGGCVEHEPAGIIGLDRRAVVSDATGATLTVIRGGDDRRTVGSGTLGWDELRTSDPNASARFWCTLLGWNASALPLDRDTHTMLLTSEGRAVASLSQLTRGEDHSRWLPVVTTRREGFNTTLKRAIAAGASMRVAPRAHAVLGNIAVLASPCGLEVALGAEPVAHTAAA